MVTTSLPARFRGLDVRVSARRSRTPVPTSCWYPAGTPSRAFGRCCRRGAAAFRCCIAATRTGRVPSGWRRAGLARQDASLPVALFRVSVGRVLVAWVSREPRRGRDPHLRVAARGRQRQVRRDRRAAPFRRRPRRRRGPPAAGDRRLHRAVRGKDRCAQAAARCRACCGALGPNAVLAVAGSGDVQRRCEPKPNGLASASPGSDSSNQSAMGASLRGRGLPRAAEWRRIVGAGRQRSHGDRAFRRWRRTASAAHRI